MSDGNLQPTEADRIVIPAEVAEASHTQEELDAWVKAEADRRGLERFWYAVPAQFRGGQAASLVPAAGAGALLAGVARAGGNEVCTSPPEEASTHSRRSVVAKAIAALGAAAAVTFLGRQKASALTCYYCGSSCYFSSFYGAYVLDCYYKFSTGSCANCCTRRFIGWGCNACYTGVISTC